MSHHALQTALTGPPDDHLDDQTLAELATVEAAGEDIEQTHPAETAHLEICLPCAEAYAELIEITLAAFEEMSAAAQAVPPAEVFAALLLDEARPRVEEPGGLETLARRLVEELPAHLTRLPAQDELLDTLRQIARRGPPPAPGHLRALAQAAVEQFSAFALYLQSAARAAWGATLNVAAAATAPWETLRLQPAAPRAVPILAAEEAPDDEWLIARTRQGTPLPLNLTLRARRLTPLACRLEIRLDRPGLADASGREVRLTYAGQTLTAFTDTSGVAAFEPLPIAALPHLEVHFRLQ